MRPEELLLYALMRLSFKTYTFTKYHSISHYQRMVLVIKKICGVDFSASSIRLFFPKVSSNHLKANIGKENGVVRWRCFKSQIDRFIQVSENDLENLLNNAESTPESVVFSMLQNLRSICNLVVAGSAGNFEIMLQIGCDFANQFHAIVKPYLSSHICRHGLILKQLLSIYTNLGCLLDMQRKRSKYPKHLIGVCTWKE